MRKECRDHIFFIGFMGAGKTSVSRCFSRITNLSLIDVDQRIVALQHKKIPKIFEEVGEQGFREIECNVLRGLIYEPRSIISCGGGVVCSEQNRKVLSELGTVIYLRVGLKEAISRISNPATRPMLSGPRPVEKIYKERLPLYKECADITIHTGKNTPSHIAYVCRNVLTKRGIL